MPSRRSATRTSSSVAPRPCSQDLLERIARLTFSKSFDVNCVSPSTNHLRVVRTSHDEDGLAVSNLTTEAGRQGGPPREGKEWSCSTSSLSPRSLDDRRAPTRGVTYVPGLFCYRSTRSVSSLIRQPSSSISRELGSGRQRRRKTGTHGWNRMTRKITHSPLSLSPPSVQEAARPLGPLTTASPSDYMKRGGHDCGLGRARKHLAPSVCVLPPGVRNGSRLPLRPCRRHRRLLRWVHPNARVRPARDGDQSWRLGREHRAG